MERKRRMFKRRCPSRLHEQLATRGEPERNFSVKQTAKEVKAEPSRHYLK